MLEYCRGGTAASQRVAFAFAAHRIRVAGRSYADFAITVFGVAGAEGKAMGSARVRVPLAVTCRPALQRVALCCSVSSCVAAWPGRQGTGPSLPFLAPLSVPRALWRRPRGIDRVGQGVKTACRTAAAAMPAIAVRHAHCASTITYTCVHVSVLQRRGNPARSCKADCRLRAQNEAPEIGCRSVAPIRACGDAISHAT
jgi:hypothetical protein